MIDNKKIEEAAKQHAEGAFISGIGKLATKKALWVVLNGCKKNF